MADPENNLKPKQQEWAGPKRIEKDGETIMVSAGLEDMDPESLVEPTEIPEEEIEEEVEALSVKVKLNFEWHKGELFGEVEYEGTLVSLKTNQAFGEHVIALNMSVEDAIQLAQCAGNTTMRHKGYIGLDYVWKRQPKNLKQIMDRTYWTLKSFSMEDITQSVCLCVVKLERNA